jgi:hypothetical protein
VADRAIEDARDLGHPEQHRLDRLKIWLVSPLRHLRLVRARLAEPVMRWLTVAGSATCWN